MTRRTCAVFRCTQKNGAWDTRRRSIRIDRRYQRPAACAASRNAIGDAP